MASPWHSSGTADLISYFTQYKPNISNKFDAVALGIHARMLSHGFKCVGVTDGEATAHELLELPEGWKSGSKSGVYTFQYNHEKLPNTYILIKSFKLDDQTLAVHAVTKSADIQSTSSATSTSTSSASSTQSISVDIKVDDYVNDKNFDDYQSLFKDPNGLSTIIDQRIVQKLLPSNAVSTTADGTNKAATSTSTSTSRETVPLTFQSHRQPRELDEDRNEGQLRMPHGNAPIPAYGDVGIPDVDDIDRDHDPLRIGGVRRPQMPIGDRPFVGDFRGDLDPFTAGRAGGSNIIGPDNFPFPTGVRGITPQGMSYALVPSNQLSSPRRL
jgi:hypothetical protein